MIHLTVPEDLSDLKPRITVLGVGGAGGNAVNNMITSKLEGVEFVVTNTDAQALLQSKAERRIQIGTILTQGLGAGSHPHIGASAAEEALPQILDHLAGSHMVFITAGMGGGTGTGAAPVIARAAKEQGILTVGVVTKPFHFEGQRRIQIAERGIEQLSRHVDTLLVIPNQNLFRIANQKTTFAEAFSMADRVLYSGVASITELMTKEGLINLDFADVRAIMSEMGNAMMGTGSASGERRAIEAAEAAISNPLLDDVSMRGARGLLISITGGLDLTLYEVDEAATRIREEVDPEANIILGATFDEELEGVMRVSVVATGLNSGDDETKIFDGTRSDLMHEGEKSDYHGYMSQEASSSIPSLKGEENAPFPSGLKREEKVRSASVPAEGTSGASYAPTGNRQEGGVSPQRIDTSSSQNQGSQDRFSDAEGAFQRGGFQNHEHSSQQDDLPFRMPAIEEFPPIAQRQFAARHAQIAQLASGGMPGRFPEKKGFFGRLAETFVRKSPATPVSRGPALPHAVRTPVEFIRRDNSSSPQAVDPNLTDEHLEIPAFLRRQAQ